MLRVFFFLLVTFIHGVSACILHPVSEEDKRVNSAVMSIINGNLKLLNSFLSAYKRLAFAKINPANFDILKDSNLNEGSTLLCVAKYFNSPQAIKILLRHGAQQNDYDARRVSFLTIKPASWVDQFIEIIDQSDGVDPEELAMNAEFVETDEFGTQHVWLRGAILPNPPSARYMKFYNNSP